MASKYHYLGITTLSKYDFNVSASPGHKSNLSFLNFANKSYEILVCLAMALALRPESIMCNSCSFNSS